MKKRISAVLISAILCSLGATAVSADGLDDFTEADTIGGTYVEDIDVLSAIGIFDGLDSDSDFHPTGYIDRAQAAKMVYSLVLGDSNVVGETRVEKMKEVYGKPFGRNELTVTVSAEGATADDILKFVNTEDGQQLVASAKYISIAATSNGIETTNAYLNDNIFPDQSEWYAGYILWSSENKAEDEAEDDSSTTLIDYIANACGVVDGMKIGEGYAATYTAIREINSKAKINFTTVPKIDYAYRLGQVASAIPGFDQNVEAESAFSLFSDKYNAIVNSYLESYVDGLMANDKKVEIKDLNYALIGVENPFDEYGMLSDESRAAINSSFADMVEKYYVRTKLLSILVCGGDYEIMG